MAAKQLKYDTEARQAVLAGVQKLSRAVVTTLGPCGRNVSVRPTALPPRCDFAKIESSSGSVRGEIQPDVRRVSRRRAGARESVRTF